MKRTFAISLIVSIVAIAVFGALAMQHASEHGHVGCLAAATPAPACPTSDVVAMFLLHAGILKGLLLAIVNGYAALALVSLLFIIVFVLMREQAGYSPIHRSPAPLFFFEKFSHSSAPFMRWLALHENSPSFI